MRLSTGLLLPLLLLASSGTARRQLALPRDIIADVNAGSDGGAFAKDLGARASTDSDVEVDVGAGAEAIAPVHPRSPLSPSQLIPTSFFQGIASKARSVRDSLAAPTSCGRPLLSFLSSSSPKPTTGDDEEPLVVKQDAWDYVTADTRRDLRVDGMMYGCTVLVTASASLASAGAPPRGSPSRHKAYLLHLGMFDEEAMEAAWSGFVKGLFPSAAGAASSADGPSSASAISPRSTTLRIYINEFKPRIDDDDDDGPCAATGGGERRREDREEILSLFAEQQRALEDRVVQSVFRAAAQLGASAKRPRVRRHVFASGEGYTAARKGGDVEMNGEVVGKWK